jgi:ABC-2 type transport system ATP-binding protein
MKRQDDSSAVACAGLGKVFGGRSVLCDLSFSVPHGSVCAIVGANGAGKTTLLKILATLVTPSAGRARVCGADVGKSPALARRRIGYMSSEERCFYWPLTGEQNLRFFAALEGMSRSASEAGITRLLDRLGLCQMRGRRFQEYSTGMKQLLSIARGLLHDPPVILADEPTRSLSPEASERFYDLVRDETKNGKTFLFASHNLPEVACLADTVLRLAEGRIAAQGQMKDVVERFPVSAGNSAGVSQGSAGLL